MGRPATSRSGDHLPELADGIRLRSAYLERGFPGIGNGRLECLKSGEAFTITATDVWSALYLAAPDLAREFHRQHSGPWPFGREPTFIYSPTTATLEANP